AAQATAARHAQSEVVSDLRMQCAARRAGGRRALPALLARAPDRDLVDHAVAAASRLDDVAGCADPDALAATAPLPRDPAARVEIASLRGRLEAVHALRLAGKYKPTLELVRPIAADAPPLAHPPLPPHA